MNEIMGESGRVSGFGAMSLFRRAFIFIVDTIQVVRFVSYVHVWFFQEGVKLKQRVGTSFVQLSVSINRALDDSNIKVKISFY